MAIGPITDEAMGRNDEAVATPKKISAAPPESYPLPWRSEAHGHGVQIHAADNEFVVQCGLLKTDLSGYIVTACNSYPVLLEALKEIAGGHGISDELLEGALADKGVLWGNCQKQAQAALDKIGGES